MSARGVGNGRIRRREVAPSVGPAPAEDSIRSVRKDGRAQDGRRRVSERAAAIECPFDLSDDWSHKHKFHVTFPMAESGVYTTPDSRGSSMGQPQRWVLVRSSHMMNDRSWVLVGLLQAVGPPGTCVDSFVTWQLFVAGLYYLPPGFIKCMQSKQDSYFILVYEYNYSSYLSRVVNSPMGYK